MRTTEQHEARGQGLVLLLAMSAYALGCGPKGSPTPMGGPEDPRRDGGTAPEIVCGVDAAELRQVELDLSISGAGCKNYFKEACVKAVWGRSWRNSFALYSAWRPHDQKVPAIPSYIQGLEVHLPPELRAGDTITTRELVDAWAMQRFAELPRHIFSFDHMSILEGSRFWSAVSADMVAGKQMPNSGSITLVAWDPTKGEVDIRVSDLVLLGEGDATCRLDGRIQTIDLGVAPW